MIESSQEVSEKKKEKIAWVWWKVWKTQLIQSESDFRQPHMV